MVLIVMALFAVVLHARGLGRGLANQRDREGGRAWAGCGENPRCESGPATIVNTSAAVSAATNRAILLIPIRLSSLGRYRPRGSSTPGGWERAGPSEPSKRPSRRSRKARCRV